MHHVVFTFLRDKLHRKKCLYKTIDKLLLFCEKSSNGIMNLDILKSCIIFFHHLNTFIIFIFDKCLSELFIYHVLSHWCIINADTCKSCFHV